MFNPPAGLPCGWWLSMQKGRSSWRGRRDLEPWPEVPHWKSWLRCMDLDAQHVPQPHRPCIFIWGYILPPSAAWHCGLALTPYPQHSLLPGGEHGWEALAHGVKQAPANGILKSQHANQVLLVGNAEERGWIWHLTYSSAEPLSYISPSLQKMVVSLHMKHSFQKWIHSFKSSHHHGFHSS